MGSARAAAAVAALGAPVLFAPAARAAPPAPAAPITVQLDSHLHAGKKKVGVPRVPVHVSGRIAAYAPGLQVQVDVFKKTRRVKSKARPVLPAAAGGGKFRLSFTPSQRGTYRIRARQVVPPGQPAPTSRFVRLFVVRPHAAQGSRGTAVRALQNRLAALGFLTPVNGLFNSSTARAVLAFRKVNGYARSTAAGRAVFRKLALGKGGFHVRYPKAGKHGEFDWSRQVLVLARGAKPVKIVHASSGKPSTPTVFGKFHFYRKSPGTNSHGMYYSNYFVGGYAVHGYPEVPTFAASHGCIRIPIPSAIAVYKWIDVGDTIYVYR
jgi:peptidoglycan hydrolase-like protein with peptidoglycan-binding domain